MMCGQKDLHRRRDTAKIDREKKNFAVGLAESFWFFTANRTREMYEMTRIHSFNQAHFRDFYSCDKNYTRELDISRNSSRE